MNGLNGLRDLPYSVRISKLNDDTLELRRLKLDLVMVYKVVHNLVNLNFEDLFHINRGRITRGHKLRLLRENSKVLARSNNFCCRLGIAIPGSRIPGSRDPGIPDLFINPEIPGLGGPDPGISGLEIY